MPGRPTVRHDAAYQRMIAQCSAMFWNAYLKDDAKARAWLAGEGFLRHVGNLGRVEHKLVH